MPKSLRRQLEHIVDSPRARASYRNSAHYILEHDYWLPVLRGRQAYFRDFILSTVHLFNTAHVDDEQAADIIKHFADTGYLWEVFNSVSSYQLPNAIFAAINSLKESGVEVTNDNTRSMVGLYVEVFRQRAFQSALISQRFESGDMGKGTIRCFDPSITRHVVENPDSAYALTRIAVRGEGDPKQMIAVLDSEVNSALLDGTL